MKKTAEEHMGRGKRKARKGRKGRGGKMNDGKRRKVERKEMTGMERKEVRG